MAHSFYILPYQPRVVAASWDNFSGSGCTYLDSLFGQASFYLLEPAANTVLCRLCYLDSSKIFDIIVEIWTPISQWYIFMALKWVMVSKWKILKYQSTNHNCQNFDFLFLLILCCWTFSSLEKCNTLGELKLNKKTNVKHDFTSNSRLVSNSHLYNRKQNQNGSKFSAYNWQFLNL